jgi:hypothetical protein
MEEFRYSNRIWINGELPNPGIESASNVWPASIKMRIHIRRINRQPPRNHAITNIYLGAHGKFMREGQPWKGS